MWLSCVHCHCGYTHVWPCSFFSSLPHFHIPLSLSLSSLMRWPQYMSVNQLLSTNSRAEKKGKRGRGICDHHPQLYFCVAHHIHTHIHTDTHAKYNTTKVLLFASLSLSLSLSGVSTAQLCCKNVVENSGARMELRNEQKGKVWFGIERKRSY